jgi:hypothetical protein
VHVEQSGPSSKALRYWPRAWLLPLGLVAHLAGLIIGTSTLFSGCNVKPIETARLDTTDIKREVALFAFSSQPWHTYRYMVRVAIPIKPPGKEALMGAKLSGQVHWTCGPEKKKKSRAFDLDFSDKPDAHFGIPVIAQSVGHQVGWRFIHFPSAECQVKIEIDQATKHGSILKPHLILLEEKPMDMIVRISADYLAPAMAVLGPLAALLGLGWILYVFQSRRRQRQTESDMDPQP